MGGGEGGCLLVVNKVRFFSVPVVHNAIRGVWGFESDVNNSGALENAHRAISSLFKINPVSTGLVLAQSWM